jgi:serine/threonine protein kinase
LEAPVIDLSRYLFEVLHQDEKFTLHRGRREGDCSGVLVLSPVAEYAGPEILEWLEHAYSLREQLDSAWAARPLAITRHWDRQVLVLEDPGGMPLDGLLGEPLDIALWLRVAISLSAAIDSLHQRGLIHKDIKPANVLVDSIVAQCWLTGFLVASRLPRERQAPEVPEFIAGTLAYMAPEQTGRMNRSIDSRCDLYSLGVTLYEMLTGRLPFTATDPMEWVHCHIARQPTPPVKLSNNFPATVSAIIMKLLAKTAEERYQTASGVESDLRRCFAEWDSQGCIADFALGQHPMPTGGTTRIRVGASVQTRIQNCWDRHRCWIGSSFGVERASWKSALWCRLDRSDYHYPQRLGALFRCARRLLAEFDGSHGG